MRIAVLWSSLSGYFSACLRALAEQPGVDLYVAHIRTGNQAPFDPAQFGWMHHARAFDGTPEHGALAGDLSAFGPDVLLINSWHFPAYRRIARSFAGRAVRVLAADNQWLGTPKQWLGVLAAPWYIAPLYDAAFVPGERQAVFARRLGFAQDRIWPGLYACDHERFSAAFAQRSARPTPPRGFLFTGRLVPEKGITTLLSAYAAYRHVAADPQPLVICGTGPLEPLCRNLAGVDLTGFVQPERLPDLMAESGCLILPSLFEPWGVVVHEAATAGMAVICSERCGAGVHLVQDGYNGFITPAGDVRALTAAMSAYAAQSDAAVAAMAVAGHELSRQFTPSRWARSFCSRVRRLIETGRQA